MLTLLFAFVLGTNDPVTTAPVDGKVYTNDEIGVSLRLPGEEWTLNDMSQGTAKVLVFAPPPDISTRCSVLYLPAALLPEGLLTREEQIKTMLGEGYKRVDFRPDTLAGKKADRLEYAVGGATTVEYGLRDREFYLIFQLAAPDEKWADPGTRQQLEAMAASLILTGGKQPAAPQPDRSTPAEVRARRRAAQQRPDQPFEVTHHHVEVEINPEQGTLRARDRITIESKTDGLTRVVLHYSVVTVDRVEGPAGLTWESQGGGDVMAGWPNSLTLSLGGPLNKGQRIIVTVEASSADYFSAVDQSLVQEVAVLGQVRPQSSFSSHVAYYPIDQTNDAAVDISLTVPSGFTAVTGGTLIDTETTGARTTFRYRTEARLPRTLPYGFAVGRYISGSAVSDSGLRLTVYGYPGEEKLIEQRVQVALESAHIFEQMMGPLPWKDVRIAHVTPERKETGVSLPGLILISDGFFEDFAEADLSDGQLNRPDVLSLIVVADELSHQWNFYAAGWPNELAEGVSTFTNCLLVERRHGREAYRKSIKFCRDAYIALSKLGRDVAVADPNIYQSDAYRGIAFCKVPAILDMLRTELGDETFFAGWRLAFSQFDPDRDGYDLLQRAFSQVGERDFGVSFDQWFFTGGLPRIALDHAVTDGQLTITIRQVQPGPLYRLDAQVLIRGGADEVIRRNVTLEEAETVVRVDCDFEVAEVVFDPDELLLKEMAPAATPPAE